MPWKFHARVVAVSCRRCEKKISAFNAHLTVPGHTNYDLDCIPTDELMEASFKIPRVSVDVNLDGEMRALVNGLLQKGRALRQQKLKHVRKQKQTLREMSLKRLHLSYQKQRKPRVIIGCTRRIENTITSSASFAAHALAVPVDSEHTDDDEKRVVSLCRASD